MASKPQKSRAQLIELVRKIQQTEGSEEQINSWLGEFEAAVPHPDASDLIFYSTREMSPEEIVEVALNYKPLAPQSANTPQLERHRAALEALFTERSRSVTLFRYSITHRAAEFAIHDGFAFRRWPLHCRDVSHVCGPTSGGPYSLEVKAAAGQKVVQYQLVFGNQELVVRCEHFALGHFGTARSPELVRSD